MQSINAHSEVDRIAQTLRDTYAGAAWHGPNVREALQGITVQQAIQKPVAGAHSIWELVLHMTSWRQFARHKVNGDITFDIVTPEQDWPSIPNDSEPAWEAALTDLERSQHHLQEALSQLKDEKLFELVPGRDYTYYKLLHGIIQHDLYHAGQIVLLKKLV